MADKKFNALPGFGLTMGFTLFYLSAIVLIPLAALVIRALRHFVGRLLAAGDDAARAGRLPAELRDLLVGRGGQCALRLAAGLGAGALPVPRPPAH